MGNDARYIFSNGDLFRKDFSIEFKSDKGNMYIPIADTKEIYCFNDITITTKLFEIFSQSGIVVHFFGYHGNYIGTFYPKINLLSGRVTVKQALAYENMRLDVAKPIVSSIGKNIKSVLYHYYRHGKNELKPFIDYLSKDLNVHINLAKDIKQLLCVEGDIWAKFYDSFRFILPDDFIINKRVRRPPDNPMNALISFGNTILYTKTITQLYQTHLNQTISFLHEPSERRFSLSLDISEAFKPIIVFKTIFDCVNNKKLSVTKHFHKELNYAMLNDDGKKIFIKAFEDRINQTFMHKTLKRKISYKQAIKLDGYKLIKFLMEGKPFEPFVAD